MGKQRLKLVYQSLTSTISDLVISSDLKMNKSVNLVPLRMLLFSISLKAYKCSLYSTLIFRDCNYNHSILIDSLTEVLLWRNKERSFLSNLLPNEVVMSDLNIME